MKPIRRDDLVYLDNNATTRADPAVVAAMLPHFSERFGNPSSAHGFGAGAREAVRFARRQVQALLGAASEQEILFTSGGSESDNTAILSAVDVMAGRDEVIVSAVEHPAVLSLCRRLEARRGIRVHRIPVNTLGQLDLDAYRAVLSERTAVVSIMWANNETGTIFPIDDLADMAKEVGALFHTDAVQAAGRLPLDLKATAIDMLSLSAHKLHGPKGVGMLYVRHGCPFSPLIYGGRQERARRAGTENVPGIVGLGQAAEMARISVSEDMPRITRLRDRLERGLLQSIGGVLINGDPSRRLANTSSIAFGGIESEAFVALLDRQGIACSSGAACSSGSMEPSHVFKAMMVPQDFLPGVVRFSLSRDNNEADIDRLLSVAPDVVASLRGQTFEASVLQPAGLAHV